MKSLIVVAALTVAATAVHPQTNHTEHTVRRSAGAPIPDATVADMAWLAGRWTGEGLGGWNEEIWSPPSGGVMMGMYRLVREGKIAFYEFLLIRETERGLAMQLKHFHPDLKGWEEKDQFVEFLYVGQSGNRIHFEGLTFERVDADRVHIYLALGKKDGRAREERFTMSRDRANGSVRP